MKRPKIIKPSQQTTNEQRRQAAALIRGLSRLVVADQYQFTVNIGDTRFNITIDKAKDVTA